jgi:mono/diheme cytochrome c family protein
MGQVKYILYASILFAGVFLSIVTANRFSSVEFIGHHESTVIDNVPNKNNGVASAGQRTFQNNCASCHALDKVLTGPALRGVTDRGPWADRKNLLKWVKNPASFISSNPYAKELQKQYGQIMPSFTNLTENEVNEIFDYISSTPAQTAVD